MKKNAQKKIKCTVCNSNAYPFKDGLFDVRYGAPGKYSIYKCQKCSFGKTVPGLKVKEIGRFYAKYYPLKSVTPESVKKSVNIPSLWLAWLLGVDNTAHWYIRNNSIVLDIGCGTGQSLLEIEKLGGKAYGVEPDPSAQKIAKKLQFRVHQGFITDNFFPGIKFDYITASQVIEHDPDPKAFLQAVYKHLKDDGKVIMSFPNINSFYRFLFSRKWINWHVPYHCNFFSYKAFVMLIDSVGFKIRKITTITPTEWTVTQILMLMQKNSEGEPGFVWKMINDAKTNSDLSLLKITKKLMKLFISIPVILINRLVDLFGQGDSFLVVMEKKNDR